MDIKYLEVSKMDNSSTKKDKMYSELNFKAIEKGVMALRENIVKYDNMKTHKDIGSAGVYALWWIGKHSEFKNTYLNHYFEKRGASGKLINIRYSKTWIDHICSKPNDPICMYVGKTSTSCKSRLKIHKRNKFNSTPIRPLADKESINKLISKNIGFSIFKLDGVENAVNRFYLENIAIGTLFPLLNVDVER